MTETLANGYSSESTQRELSNEYEHDRVWMIFKNLCILVLWMKVASALEGLSTHSWYNTKYQFNMNKKISISIHSLKLSLFFPGRLLHLQKLLKVLYVETSPLFNEPFFEVGRDKFDKIRFLH